MEFESTSKGWGQGGGRARERTVEEDEVPAWAPSAAMQAVEAARAGCEAAESEGHSKALGSSQWPRLP